MKAQILNDDKGLCLKAGEIYNAKPYLLDPAKITIIKDGEEHCNQYRSEVKLIWNKKQSNHRK